jgi:L-asparaginase
MTDNQTKPTLPRVHILATGGTIAGVQRKLQNPGYDAAGIAVADLLKTVPHLETVANLTAEQLVNIGSNEMNDSVWLALAGRLNQLLADPQIDGVVIVHGTDTMEETAWFLDLVTPPHKTVVLVGAMRPATATSPDGPGNLQAAVMVAADPGARGRGVLVYSNNEIHHARSVVKVDTMGLHAFASARRGLAGIFYGRPDWFEPAGSAANNPPRFVVEGLQELPRVDILYAHAGMHADLITAAVERGAKGIVVAGVGGGNMPAQAADVLTAAVTDGIAVVRSSRLQSGMVWRNIEIDDDARGFVAAGDLNAAKARVLLQLALTVTSDWQQIQQLFGRC